MVSNTVSASKYSSQYMNYTENTYQHEDYNNSRRISSHAFKEAEKNDPDVINLWKEAQKLQNESDWMHESPLIYYRTAHQRTEIDEFKQKIIAGEIPAPDLSVQPNLRIEEEAIHFIARKELELESAYKKLDDAFVRFEATPEAAKSLEYMVASNNGNYDAFLKDHPKPVVVETVVPVAESAHPHPAPEIKAEVPHANSTTLKSEATELAEEASKFKWTTNKKLLAGAGAVAVVAGGVTWAVKHQQRKNPEQDKGATR